MAPPTASQEAPGPLVRRFACENGRVVDAAFLNLGGRNIAVLSIDGAEPVVLSIAMAASGARYVGAGLQWWGKGLDEANFAPLGGEEDIASAPGTTCRGEG